MKKTIPLMLLLLIFISMLTLTINIKSVESPTPPETEWSRTYGGTNQDWANSVAQTADGGYVLAGQTGIFPTPFDFLLVKTFANGTMQWNQTYGVGDWDHAASVVQTSDGGYALTGETGPFVGPYDVLLVKTNSTGHMEWNKTYAHGGDEISWSLVQTPDEGYAIAGYTDSFGAGGYDFWMVKIDSSGNVQWNQTYGGTNGERAYSMVQTSDGGYALAGYTQSFGAGNRDFLLIKLAPPSARALKESALTELESALSFDPGDDDLVQAIDYIHMSLGDMRGRELGSEVTWINDWHVSEEKGADTFQYEEAAIDKLDAYVLNDDNVDPGVAAIIDSVREKLYKADKSIAEKAIEEAEAAGGVPSDIAKAKELYKEAVETYAAGTYVHTSSKLSDVIDLFEEAWEKAVNSH